jgi:hypothetical protein
MVSKEKLAESARSRKAGGLCLRPSAGERLSIFELGLSTVVFMVTKGVSNFLAGFEKTENK